MAPGRTTQSGIADLTGTDGATGDRRRWIALVVVCLAMFMNALDGSIVNVALPDIQKSLHFSQSGLTWVVDAYLISFGSFLLMAGRLGDLIGRKKVFLAGVALFTLASIACGSADSQGLLVAARFVQGIGGALSSSVIVAIIVTEFPSPRAGQGHERVRVRRRRRRLGRAPRRRRADPSPVLALDLLRECACRHRHAGRGLHLAGGQHRPRHQGGRRLGGFCPRDGVGHGA